MKFGTFLAPFHAPNENPTLALQRDLKLLEHIDMLGFHEAWIGEHHSGGMEIIASPEIFIAAAAERTKQIRLGTGVITLPYHNPFLTAERINQLDHQTKGRTIFGVGAGALPYDADMIGVDVSKIREKLEEALEAIIPLLRGEQVTQKTDWFNLREAKLQLPSYTKPNIEMAIPSVVSPSGPLLGGKFGMSLLSTAATTAAAFEALPETWNTYVTQANHYGHEANRKTWRLVGPIHIAETREKARGNVSFGLQKWLHYFRHVGHLPLASAGEGSLENDIAAITDAGMAVIGTPDDLYNQISRLNQQSGGFGVFLEMSHNWADFPETLRSYELIARYVMPKFIHETNRQEEAYTWAMNKKPTLLEKRQKGIDRAIQNHENTKKT